MNQEKINSTIGKFANEAHFHALRKITPFVEELSNDVGQAETARYFCHMLTKDTSFTCTEETKSRLRRFGSDVRNELGATPITPYMTWIAERFLKKMPQHIPVKFESDLKYLQEPIESQVEAKPVESTPAEDPSWPYLSWVDDTAAGYASALAGGYRTFVKADKLPDAVREAVENVLQSAVIGKQERVLMVDGKNGTKVAKALQGIGFNVQNVKCKNGKAKLTVTYE